MGIFGRRRNRTTTVQSQAAPPAPPERKAAAPKDPARAKAKLYLDALGPKHAAKAMADGTPIMDALTAVCAEQRARIEALEADLAKANARLAALHADGEPGPLSTRAGDEENTADRKAEQNLGDGIARAAAAMKLPGRK